MAVIHITREDSRLAGCTYLCISAANRIAVSCPDSKRLTICNTADSAAVVGSLLMTKTPGAVLYLASKVWTITEDGYLLRFTNADTPVQDVASVRLYSERNTWIAACSNIILVPGRLGSVVSLSTAGAVLSTLDDVLPRIECAMANGAYLYCFDGRGLGAVVSVNTTTGAMTTLATFTAQDCQGVMRGHVYHDVTDYLILAVKERDCVVTLAINDVLAPEITGRDFYPGYTLNSVLDYGGHTPLTDEYYEALNINPWWPITHGIVLAGDDSVYLHAGSGRISFNSET